jgi:hypothetical protein
MLQSCSCEWLVNLDCFAVTLRSIVATVQAVHLLASYTTVSRSSETLKNSCNCEAAQPDVQGTSTSAASATQPVGKGLTTLLVHLPGTYIFYICSTLCTTFAYKACAALRARGSFVVCLCTDSGCRSTCAQLHAQPVQAEFCPLQLPLTHSMLPHLQALT